MLEGGMTSDVRGSERARRRLAISMLRRKEHCERVAGGGWEEGGEDEHKVT